MDYLHWDEKIITDFSDTSVSDMYAHGYVFTRIGRGVMHQTRSVRIDISKFELTSENRRVLKKMDGIHMHTKTLPLHDYHWQLGKTAKDFYEMKFGHGIMSTQKIKEMLTDATQSNFTTVLIYTHDEVSDGHPVPSDRGLGYVITHLTQSLLHYSYPFYHIDQSPKDMGLGMMTQALQFAKEKGLKYVYLGSLQRPGDVYKLQFAGLEWFDGGPQGIQAWSTDIEKIKKILNSPHTSPIC